MATIKKTEHGIATFEDGQKTSLRKNKNGNYTFHVWESDIDD